MTQADLPSVLFEDGTEDHAADLYAYDELAEPLDTLDQITDEHARFYREQGYLAVAHVLTEQQIADAKAALSDMIRGKLPTGSSYRVMYEASAKGRLDAMSVDEREKAVRKVYNFAGVDPRLDQVQLFPKLLAAIHKLGCTDPQAYQAQALLKGPGGREKPWHQDHAYFNLQLRDDSRVMGAWIALDEATVANGCMHIMPGKHREAIVHFRRRDWQICDTTTQAMRDQVLAVPLPPGGVLFFDSLLPHGTPKNHSPLRRQAVQFHYAPKGHPLIDAQQRMDIFGSEGKDVTC